MVTTSNAVKRRHAFLGVFVAVLVAVSGCAEQGFPSRGIALVRQSDGRLMLVGTTCSAALSKIIIGSGADWWAKGDIALTPVNALRGEYQVDLPEVGPPFKSAPRMTAEPVVPFFVRVEASDGVQLQSFTELPSRGQAIFLGPQHDKNLTQSIESFPPVGYCK